MNGWALNNYTKLLLILLIAFFPVGIVWFVSADVAEQSQLFCRNPEYLSDNSPTAQPPPMLFPEDFGRSVCNPRPDLSQLENDEIKASLSQHTRDWYSRHLVAACETSLADFKQTPITVKEKAVRFLWLRSFEATVVVRVHLKENGTSLLVAKQLSGLGGYDAGKLARRIERPLSTKEHQQIIDFLGQSKFFEQEAIKCGVHGFDGSRWVFEKWDQEGYRYVDRWSPRSGDSHDFGLLLLEMTGWHYREIY